jgi:hypothetical protein
MYRGALDQRGLCSLRWVSRYAIPRVSTFPYRYYGFISLEKNYLIGTAIGLYKHNTKELYIPLSYGFTVSIVTRCKLIVATESHMERTGDI